MRYPGPRSLGALVIALLPGSAISAVLVTVVSGALSPGANAQWTVTNLHPAGASTSQAHRTSGTQQVGWARLSSGETHAGLWSGTAASWVDLNPAFSDQSQAYGTAGTQQVGHAHYSIGPSHAGLWNGTAASWVDLHPSSQSSSNAFDTSGTQQVGYAFGAASLWSGTAASWVSLHPAGATGQSIAFSTSGTQQAGWAEIGGVNHAGLWRGTAASWVDLHPAGATGESIAFDTSGTQQVGYARVGGVMRASLWSGAAVSWVDLSPAGSTFSEAVGASCTHQVGLAAVGGVQRASLWSGTASSWIDLHAMLPPGFRSSEARDVWSDGFVTHVVGWATTSLGGPQAFLWTHSGPISNIPTTYYVNGACGDDSWTGTSAVCQAPDGPKRTIQAGIYAASSCSPVLEVIVADGVYTGVGNKNLDFGGRNITVRSESGDPELCVIDCQGTGRGFYFHSGETPLAVVDGITIRNGDVSAFPTFFLRQGGGIFIDGGSPTIRNCIIENCLAIGGGGGLHVSGGDARIIDCRFLDNSAGWGGGLETSDGNAQIINCEFIGNSVSNWGGAIYNFNNSNALIVNCTIVGNFSLFQGGGIYNEHDSGTTRVSNCILWGNNPNQIFDNLVVSEVTYSTVQQGWPGVGNIRTLPAFVNPSNRNYRVFEGSPSNDAGNNTLVPAGILTDLDSNPRYVDDPAAPNTGLPGNGFSVVVDMGAYEYQSQTFCYADCDQSTGIGVLDLFDFLCFQGSFVNGEPYACDCDTSTGVLVCDLFDFICFQGAFVAGCP